MADLLNTDLTQFSYSIDEKQYELNTELTFILKGVKILKIHKPEKYNSDDKKKSKKTKENTKWKITLLLNKEQVEKIKELHNKALDTLSKTDKPSSNEIKKFYYKANNKYTLTCIYDPIINGAEAFYKETQEPVIDLESILNYTCNCVINHYGLFTYKHPEEKHKYQTVGVFYLNYINVLSESKETQIQKSGFRDDV